MPACTGQLNCLQHTSNVCSHTLSLMVKHNPMICVWIRSGLNSCDKSCFCPKQKQIKMEVEVTSVSWPWLTQICTHCHTLTKLPRQHSKKVIHSNILYPTEAQHHFPIPQKFWCEGWLSIFMWNKCSLTSRKKQSSLVGQYVVDQKPNPVEKWNPIEPSL